MRNWSKPWKNPVIVKDFRTRMRGNRAFILLTAHLLILGGLAILVYILLLSSMSPRGSLEERRIFGKAIFGLLVGMEMVMISFVAPALTSGAISTERERQTYDLLRVTLLSPRSLVMGKYLSGLVFIFLLLFTSLPLQSPAFLLGGLLPEEILIATLILAVTALAFCAVGLFTSSFFTRTLVFSVLSYAFAIFLVFGIPIILIIFLILFNTSIETLVEHLPRMWQAVLLGAAWLLLSITPFGTIVASEVILLDQSSIFYATIPFPSNAEVVLPSPWLVYTPIYLLFSGLLLWLSVRRVSKLEK